MSTPKLPEITANIRQEVGVMVGFMAIFGLVTIAYSLVWYMKNRHQASKEEERQRELIERGFGPREKMRNGNANGGVFEQGLGEMGGVDAVRGTGRGGVVGGEEKVVQ